MELTARDIMQSNVRVVDPAMKLPALERAFIAECVSGFPVIENGRLVGIISRSDIVRQLCVEQSLAEMVSDYQRDVADFTVDPSATFEAIAERVGQRIDHLRVNDVMVRDVIAVLPDQPLSEVAKTLIDHRIHRVPVTQEGRLVGIITTLDLVRLIAQGRVKPV